MQWQEELLKELVEFRKLIKTMPGYKDGKLNGVPLKICALLQSIDKLLNDYESDNT